MHIQRVMPATLGLVVALAMISPGCGGGGDTSSATSSGGPSSSSSSGAGGAGGGGSGGAGGQGGGVVVDTGKPATETVSAGEVSKSTNYRMVFTFGQPTQNQGKTTSPGYQMQGGLVGANGGAK